MPRTHALLLAFAISTIGSLSVFARDAPPAAGAIRLSPCDGLLAMPVVINGVRGGLVVDTGAASTILSKSTAKVLRVTLQSSGQAGTGSTGSGRIETGRISAVVPGRKPGDFPTLSGTHHFVAFLEDAQVPGLGRSFGSIGLPELSAAGAVVDCAGASMTLHPKGDFRGPKGGPGLAMIRYFPFEGSRDYFWTLPVRIGGREAVMIVDTGADRSVISVKFAKLAGIPLTKSRVSAYGITGAPRSMAQGIARGVVLGGRLSLGDVRMLSIDSALINGSSKNTAGKPVPVAGILGLDQLTRIKGFIDCKRGVIHSGI